MQKGRPSRRKCVRCRRNEKRGTANRHSLFCRKNQDDFIIFQGLINNVDEFRCSLIKIVDVYWKDPGVTRDVQWCTRETQLINLI